MTYKFLHHLTQAALPVVIYDHRLIQQLSVYEHQSLIVLAKQDTVKANQIGVQKGCSSPKDHENRSACGASASQNI